MAELQELANRANGTDRNNRMAQIMAGWGVSEENIKKALAQLNSGSPAAGSVLDASYAVRGALGKAGVVKSAAEGQRLFNEVNAELAEIAKGRPLTQADVMDALARRGVANIDYNTAVGAGNALRGGDAQYQADTARIDEVYNWLGGSRMVEKIYNQQGALIGFRDKLPGFGDNIFDLRGHTVGMGDEKALESAGLLDPIEWVAGGAIGKQAFKLAGGLVTKIPGLTTILNRGKVYADNAFQRMLAPFKSGAERGADTVLDAAEGLRYPGFDIPGAPAMRRAFDNAIADLGMRVNWSRSGKNFVRGNEVFINARTARGSTLLDEYTHAFNNTLGRRGVYLDDALSEAHGILHNRAVELGGTNGLSLNQNIRYHQLELRNMLIGMKGKLPSFAKGISETQIEEFLRYGFR
jgi:hypothetical protein